MALNNAQDAPHAARLLDQAYEALLRSDYAALPGLSADLESELRNPKDKMTEASLQVLRQKANRNASVLLAAQRGIRSARRRLEDMRSAASGLVTYDRSGRRAEVSESRNLAQRL